MFVSKKQRLFDYLQKNSGYGFLAKHLSQELNIKPNTVYHIISTNRDRVQVEKVENTTYYLAKI